LVIIASNRFVLLYYVWPESWGEEINRTCIRTWFAFETEIRTTTRKYIDLVAITFYICHGYRSALYITSLSVIVPLATNTISIFNSHLPRACYIKVSCHQTRRPLTLHQCVLPIQKYTRKVSSPFSFGLRSHTLHFYVAKTNINS
jgi:hypothetical protein